MTLCVSVCVCVCVCACLQESRLSEQAKEVTKLKEDVGSANIKVRWAQNKLKTETDAHKVHVHKFTLDGCVHGNTDCMFTGRVSVCSQDTKSQLASTSKKLQQAREEGEQIRSDLKTMITQYQVPPPPPPHTHTHTQSHSLHV